MEKQSNKVNLCCWPLIIFFASVQVTRVNAACPESVTIATAPVEPLVSIKGGEADGELQQVTREFLWSKGIQAEWIVVNWARALYMSERGEVDGIFPTLYSSERDLYLDYDLPPIGSVQVSLYRNSNITQIPELAGASIATLRSFEYSRAELDMAKVYEVANFERAIAMLEKQRVDFIFGVKDIIDYKIAELSVRHVIEHKGVSVRPIYLALAENSKQYRQIKACFN